MIKITYQCNVCKEIYRTNSKILKRSLCPVCAEFLNRFDKECKKHPTYSSRINYRRIFSYSIETISIIKEGVLTKKPWIATTLLIENKIDSKYHTTMRKTRVIEDHLSIYKYFYILENEAAININIIFKV